MEMYEKGSHSKIDLKRGNVCSNFFTLKEEIVFNGRKYIEVVCRAKRKLAYF